MVVIEKYGKLYATEFRISQTLIVVIDANTGTVLEYINTRNPYQGWFIQLAKDEELGKVYALHMDGLYQIDAKTDAITIIPGIEGTIYSSLGVNPVTHELFYMWGAGSNLVVIDPFSHNHFEVAIDYGYGIGVNWKDNKVYIAYAGGGDANIYNRNTGVVSKYSTHNNDPTILVYNPIGNRMYSSCEVTLNINIIDGVTDTSLSMPMWSSVYPYVCYSTNHVFYSGYPVAIIDDYTFSVRTIDARGDLGTINQLTKRFYIATDDTIKVIQDQNDPWPLNKPVLLYPVNGIIGQPRFDVFRWETVPGATSYDLEYTSIPYSWMTGMNKYGIEDVSSEFSIYGDYLQFYWHVRAKNAECTGYWSDTWTFTTSGFIFIPKLNLPQNNATNQPSDITFSWQNYTDAVSYRLQVSPYPNFSSTSFDQNGIISTSKKVSGLADNTRYFWRINAITATETSEWSETWNFTTKNPVNANHLTEIIPLRIYPNPVNDILNIEGTENKLSNLSIISPDGKILKHIAGFGISQVNVSTLQKGIYLLKIINSDITYTIPILKQ
ncbi:MAG: T9SS type A sorting domain-containing protein [Bacteroidales bacterium]|nr:T9SS type A sorting domain-containing protein [Bacteroidales bacterium]